MSTPRGMARSPRAVAARLYRGEHRIDFPRLWRWTLLASLAALLLSIAGFALRGLDLGIDFNGGTAWEVPAPGVSVAETREALDGTGVSDAKIQTVGGDTIRVRADIDDEPTVGQVRTVLAEMVGAESADVSVTTVGPSWGSQVTAKARNALLAFFVLVALYISVRLEWKMAVCALAAVLHDIVLCLGFYALFQFEITPATIIAFLTIMGYSLYDTIVVYDKAREVVGKVSTTGRYTYTEMMNIALNRVLMRSVNTTITSMLPVVSMLVIGSFVLGAVTLEEFSVALLVGIVVGTYSSLFVAASLVAWMKEREPEHVAAAEKIRLRRRGDVGAEAFLDQPTFGRGSRGGIAGRGGARRPDSAKASGTASSDPAQPSSGDDTRPEGGKPTAADRMPSAASPAGQPVIEPRPRKKKRRRKKR